MYIGLSRALGSKCDDSGVCWLENKNNEVEEKYLVQLIMF